MSEHSMNLITPDDNSEFDRIKMLAALDKNDFLIVNQELNVRLELPNSLFRVLVDAAQQFAQGHAVGLTHYEKDLSTQQAAEILRVSRPHVVKLLEEGEIPYYNVGSHRRISLKDVLDYKTRRDVHRKSKLIELYKASDDAGLYEIDTFPQNEDE